MFSGPESAAIALSFSTDSFVTSTLLPDAHVPSRLQSRKLAEHTCQASVRLPTLHSGVQSDNDRSQSKLAASQAHETPSRTCQLTGTGSSLQARL